LMLTFRFKTRSKTYKTPRFAEWWCIRICNLLPRFVQGFFHLKATKAELAIRLKQHLLLTLLNKKIYFLYSTM
jgi:hypothetical protein